MIKVLLIAWWAVLTLLVIGLYLVQMQPSMHDVHTTDITVDEVSGHCYRLRWVVGTSRYPGGPVSTDGVDCPWGIGNSPYR